MKNFAKIGIAVLGVFALVMLSQTNATNTLSLEITGGSLTCETSPGDVTAAGVNVLMVAQTSTGAAAGFSCTDLDGGNRVTQYSVTSDNLTNGTNTIAPAAISLAVTAKSITTGSATCDIAAGTAGALNAASEILVRTSSNGELCTVINSGTITVSIPAGQAPGSYTSTLTFVAAATS